MSATTSPPRAVAAERIDPRQKTAVLDTHPHSFLRSVCDPPICRALTSQRGKRKLTKSVPRTKGKTAEKRQKLGPPRRRQDFVAPVSWRDFFHGRNNTTGPMCSSFKKLARHPNMMSGTDRDCFWSASNAKSCRKRLWRNCAPEHAQEFRSIRIINLAKIPALTPSSARIRRIARLWTRQYLQHR